MDEGGGGGGNGGLFWMMAIPVAEGELSDSFVACTCSPIAEWKMGGGDVRHGLMVVSSELIMMWSMMEAT